MSADELKSLQAPIKERYRQRPESASITLQAEGKIGDDVTCRVETGKALVEAGLHPATGGDGLSACSGDMLLEALVACAGVTLRAVATALGVPLRDATVRAEGDLDFRGTLGVSKETPVGFQKTIRTFLVRLFNSLPAFARRPSQNKFWYPTSSPSSASGKSFHSASWAKLLSKVSMSLCALTPWRGHD